MCYFRVKLFGFAISQSSGIFSHGCNDQFINFFVLSYFIYFIFLYYSSLELSAK